MKKGIVAVALSLALAFAVVGCAKKAIVHITLEGIGNYSLTQVPSDTVNASVNDNEITTTLNKEGDYAFTVQTEEGKEYTVTVTYKDGTATAQTDADADVEVSVE